VTIQPIMVWSFHGCYRHQHPSAVASSLWGAIRTKGRRNRIEVVVQIARADLCCSEIGCR
jgi:hypothetical protein